jgi:hypothetical protein
MDRFWLDYGCLGKIHDAERAARWRDPHHRSRHRWAVVGGFISTYMLGFGDVTGFDVPSMVISVGCALLVLVVYGVFSRRRS